MLRAKSKFRKKSRVQLASNKKQVEHIIVDTDHNVCWFYLWSSQLLCFQIPSEINSKPPETKQSQPALVENEDLKKFRFRQLVESKKGSIKVATVFSQTSSQRRKGKRM